MKYAKMIDIKEYKAKGYVVTTVLSPKDVAGVLTEASKLEDMAAALDRSLGDFNLEAPGGGFAAQDGLERAYHGVLRKASNVVSHSRMIFDISQSSSMVDLAAMLLGSTECQLLHSVLWYKPPHVGSAKPPHQDAPYLAGNPERFVTIWTALDECTRENGCLEIRPGSHAYGLTTHEGDEPHVPAKHGDLGKSIAVPLCPGEAIAFHPYLVHGSGANRSARPRRALMLRYEVT